MTSVFENRDTFGFKRATKTVNEYKNGNKNYLNSHDRLENNKKN